MNRKMDELNGSNDGWMQYKITTQIDVLMMQKILIYIYTIIVIIKLGWCDGVS